MPLTLADAVRALRDRWWILIVAALIAAAAAYAYTKLPWVEPRWRSSVWIQAEGRFDYGSALALERRLRPIAEQVRQNSVMRLVDRNLHTDLPAEKMLAETKAEPVQDSNQIRVDYEDAHGPRAQQVVVEIANVFTQDWNAKQEAALREERVILTVLDRENTATLVWPQTRVLVPAAALLGLLVAGAVVLALASLDDTLKTAEDVDRVLGIPVLGQVPKFDGGKSHRRRESDPGAPVSTTSTSSANAAPVAGRTR